MHRKRCSTYASAPGKGKRQMVQPVALPVKEGDAKREEMAVHAAERLPYIMRYRDLCQSIQQPSEFRTKKEEMVKDVIREENEWRLKFADPMERESNEQMKDPFLSLVPVHRVPDINDCLPLSTSEADVPKVFPLGLRRRPAGSPAIVSERQFKDNFEVFTEGLLRKLNWDNVFCAGGCVLAAMLPLSRDVVTNQQKRVYYHHEAYTSSDIDLFLYGLSDEEANEKLKEIYFTICEAVVNTNGRQPVCFRSTHSVTIVSMFPYRHVQIILRNYKSPAEVLMCFDVDSCGVGFDGSSVWTTQRAHNAIVSQYNTVDMSRRSPSYETRLSKYASRGFEVLVPCLKRAAVDPQIFEISFEKTQGLSRLLSLEKLSTREARTAFQMGRKLSTCQLRLNTYHGKLMNRLTMDFTMDVFLREQLNTFDENVCDYATIFLPWGPKWDVDKVCDLMHTKDTVLNSKYSDPFRLGHRHPCFFGTAEQVLLDCCGRCPPKDKEEEEMDKDKFVSGPLVWMNINPGQQTIGSFHPITEGEWAEGTHISQGTERFVALIGEEFDGKKLHEGYKMLREQDPSISVNGTDPIGRTPLMVACLLNNLEAAKMLLAQPEIKVDMRMRDGRTATHLACQYGNAEILKELAKAGVKLNQLLKEHLKKKEEEEREIAKKQLQEDEELDRLPKDRDYYVKKHSVRRRRAMDAAKRAQELQEEGYLDKVGYDDEDQERGMTPLMYAAFFGHVECAKVLMDTKEVDILKPLRREEEYTFIHSILSLATMNHQSEMVKFLVEREPKLLNQADENGRLPLHHAAAMGDDEITKILLESRSKLPSDETHPDFNNIDMIDTNQNTPLILAIAYGHAEVVKTLLRAGASVQYTNEHLLKEQRRRGGLFSGSLFRKNIYDQSQNLPSPIFAAVVNHHPAILQILLENGADENTLFHGNMSILDKALQLLQALKAKERIEQPPQPNEEAKQCHEIPASVYYNFFLEELEKEQASQENMSVSGFNWKRFCLQWLKEAALKQEKKKDNQKSQKKSYVNPTTLEQIQTAKESIAILRKFKAHTSKEMKLASADANTRRQALQSVNQQNLLQSRQKILSGKSHGRYGGSEQGSFTVSIMTISGYGGASVLTKYSETFIAVKIPSMCFSYDCLVEEPRMQRVYLEFFDAVARNDCAKVTEMTSPNRLNACGELETCVVGVTSQMTAMNPLDVAMHFGHSEMVKLLLEIIKKQYTPEGEENEADEFSVTHFSNVDLLNKNYEGKTIKRKGHKFLERMEQYKKEMTRPESNQIATVIEDAEGNPLKTNLQSVCSFGAIVVHELTPRHRSCLEVGVLASQTNAVKALLESLNAHDVEAPETLAKNMNGFLNSRTMASRDVAAPPLKMSQYLLRCRPSESPEPGILPVVAREDDLEMFKTLLEVAPLDALMLGRVDEPALASKHESGYYLADAKYVTSNFATFVLVRLAAKKMLRFLLEGGLDSYVRFEGEPLYLKKNTGITAEASGQGTVFHNATDIEVLQVLLQHAKAKIGANELKGLLDKHVFEYPIDPYAIVEHTEWAKSVKRVYFVNQPIVLAAQNDPQLLEPLLQSGASTHIMIQGQPQSLVTQIVVAAGDAVQRIEEGVKTLMKYSKNLSAEVNHTKGKHVMSGPAALFAAVDSEGRTVLHELFKCHREVTEKVLDLLESACRVSRLQSSELQPLSAIINSIDKNGETPLLRALTKSCTVSQVQRLISNGADIAHCDNRGSLPLHRAAMNDTPLEVLELLFPAVNEKMEDVTGKTPYDWSMLTQLAKLEDSRLKLFNRRYDTYERENEIKNGRIVNVETMRCLQQCENHQSRQLVDPERVREQTNTQIAEVTRKVGIQRDEMETENRMNDDMEADEDDEESDCDSSSSS